MSQFAFGGSILVQASVMGSPVTVNITTASGGTPTVYSDENRTTPASMPTTISADTWFYVGSDDNYAVTATVGVGNDDCLASRVNGGLLGSEQFYLGNNTGYTVFLDPNVT
jgi:hypothetical protein